MINLLLIRHGIRGVNIKLHNSDGRATYIQELTDLEIPFLATGMNITEIGQRHSRQLGEYIRRYKKEKLIVRADNSSRTQMTAKYIIDGIRDDNRKKTAIQISKISPDPIAYNQEPIDRNLYFRLLYEQLFIIEHKYSSIQAILEKIFKINLSGLSIYDTDFKLMGSIAFAKTFCNIAIFEYLKGSSWLKLSRDDVWHLAEFTTWTLGMRTNNILINQRCQKPLAYIIDQLIGLDTFTILVSHDTNIYGICKLLNIEYKLGDWPTYYIPPNSGLLFQSDDDKIIIKAIGLNMDLNIAENELIQISNTLFHQLKPETILDDVYDTYELYV